MIAKTLVFVCATFGLVTGSCVEIKTPQEFSSSQVISLPVQTESSFSSPAGCGNVFSSGASYISAPVVSDNVFNSGCSSSPIFTSSVVSAPVVSENIFTSSPSISIPVSSSSSLSEIFSSGSSSGSSFGVAPTNGPEPSPISFFQAPAVTLPAVEGPIITLSSQPIPRPQVLSQRCICTKTIVKPQVYQRLVTVPRIQRYLQRTVSPVVENVAYRSTPITQASSSSSGSGSGALVISGSGSSSGSGSGALVISGSGSSSGSSSSSPVSFSSGSSCQNFC